MSSRGKRERGERQEEERRSDGEKDGVGAWWLVRGPVAGARSRREN